jgi:hypothetical protein
MCWEPKTEYPAPGELTVRSGGSLSEATIPRGRGRRLTFPLTQVSSGGATAEYLCSVLRSPSHVASRASGRASFVRPRGTLCCNFGPCGSSVLRKVSAECLELWHHCWTRWRSRTGKHAGTSSIAGRWVMSPVTIATCSVRSTAFWFETLGLALCCLPEILIF